MVRATSTAHSLLKQVWGNYVLCSSTIVVHTWMIGSITLLIVNTGQEVRIIPRHPVEAGSICTCPCPEPPPSRRIWRMEAQYWVQITSRLPQRAHPSEIPLTTYIWSVFRRAVSPPPWSGIRLTRGHAAAVPLTHYWQSCRFKIFTPNREHCSSGVSISSETFLLVEGITEISCCARICRPYFRRWRNYL